MVHNIVTIAMKVSWRLEQIRARYYNREHTKKWEVNTVMSVQQADSARDYGVSICTIIANFLAFFMGYIYAGYIRHNIEKENILATTNLPVRPPSLSCTIYASKRSKEELRY